MGGETVVGDIQMALSENTIPGLEQHFIVIDDQYAFIGDVARDVPCRFRQNSYLPHEIY